MIYMIYIHIIYTHVYTHIILYIYIYIYIYILLHIYKHLIQKRKKNNWFLQFLKNETRTFLHAVQYWMEGYNYFF